MTKDKIEEIGQLFRFITPILITVIGFFLVREVNTINKNIEALKRHETQHQIWAQKVLRMIEVRFIRIENKIGIENKIQLDPGEQFDNDSLNKLTVKENTICRFFYPDFS